MVAAAVAKEEEEDDESDGVFNGDISSIIDQTILTFEQQQQQHGAQSTAEINVKVQNMNTTTTATSLCTSNNNNNFYPNDEELFDMLYRYTQNDVRTSNDSEEDRYEPRRL